MKKIILVLVMFLLATPLWGTEILIIKNGGTENDVASILSGAGMSTTITVYDYEWDGTNPPPDNFDAMVLLNGRYGWASGMSTSGQTALINYVQNGGGLLITEWVAYEYANGRYASMGDLIIIRRSSGSWYTPTYQVVQAHDITANLPSAFTLPYHAGNVGSAIAEATVLITASGVGDAVAVREYGQGRIVQFAMAGNYEGANPWDTNMQQLLVDAVEWAAGSGDSDGDGVLNKDDNCRLTPNPGQEDADGDGVGDLCDNCPDTPNADQADDDGDGVGNVCDPDIDGDGVPNEVDNCPLTPNTGQEDSDGDGIGNVCDVEAICVPWQPSNPSIPHYTYHGAETTLKGIARQGATEFRWDFGDGGGTAWMAVADPYNLGVKHAYNGAVGQLFIATLYVRDDSGHNGQDEYLVKIHESSDLSIPEHLDVRINIAIDEGLWYLHTHMIRGTYAAGSPGYEQPYGYWPESYGYPVAAVGTSVDAFQLHGSKANMDYDSDPYVETVQRALNYLLYNTHAFNIGAQPAGDPDTNGNGIGLVSHNSSNLYDTRQTYVGGIAFVALASSGAPSVVAKLGGEHVYGRTYAEIVQDMVDFFAWGQVDSGWGRGGWRYRANYSSSDMSTTQWPPLGMIAAEENMGSIVPQFVRNELALYLNIAQSTVLNNDNGGFAYYYTDSTQWYNITKTAAGIICHEFLSTPLTDPKVQSSIGFIYRHWNDTGTSWDHTKLHGNSYGMYGLMKACRIPEPDITQITEYDYIAGQQTTNSFDWYYTPAGQAQQGLASYCVATQQTDGSWDDNVGSNPVYDAFCTGWRILVLLKGVTIIPPEASICDCDEQEYNFNQDIHLDGSCSYHPDITRSIVSYEWDFDYDGTFATDSTGVEATIAGGYSVEGIYPVALRVTDDNPDYLGGPQTDIYVCNVDVHEPPHCPHAFADGPYIGWIGLSITLDASTSWDPDNEIVSYDWDLDNDGLFGAEDNDCFGEPSDAVGINAQWTWHEPYLGVIGLRVIDAPGEIEGIPFDPCPDIDYTTVEIGNHAPECDPGGPYITYPGSTITLDGTASYDVDPGDEVSFAWDLDNDGEFDDSYEAQPEFTVGFDLIVYDICLKVTDNFGKYSIKCTTVEIIPNMPPIAICQDVTAAATDNCQGIVAPEDVDNGSSDPDGDPITLSLSPSGPYPLGTTTVMLTVTDDQGATDTCSATVTVVDMTQPTISCPADVTLECPADTSVDATGMATSMDNCDPSPTITFGDMIVLVCGNTKVIERTWTATDASGNSSTCVQTITVMDTTPPVFTMVPEDLTVQRDGNGNETELNQWLASLVEATDTCGAVTITNNYPDSFPYECGNTGSLTVTWIAEDECENTSETLATFTIEDPTADVTYNGDTLVSTEGAATVNVNLIASLLDDQGNVPDIDGEEVTFTLTADGVGTIVKTVSSVDGVASLVIPLEPAIYMTEVTLGCSDFKASAIIVVYNPDGGFATGGGWIVPEDEGSNTYPNQRANFGFNARYKQDDPTGHLEFRYSDGYIDLKSSSIEQLVITGGKIVQFKGYASVNKEPGHWFFVKAIDEGEPGVNDYFDIKVWAPGMSEEDDEPTERAGGFLQGGNIVVHTK